MHESFMSRALLLAESGRYTALPNPMVGAVIVKDGQVIAEGFHEKPGNAHAEINALNQAGPDAKNATLYINLEPCCHRGRTPPCTDALIRSGVKTVYVGREDPNPLIHGKGIQTLREQGITVHVGLLEKEAQELNRIFCHYIQTKTPYVVGKWALSWDGKMAVNGEDDPTLSSPESLKDLHELRQCLPAILIGAETARRDNPSLTVRHTAEAHPKHPQRFVLNSKGDLSPELSLFNGSLPGQTGLICTEEHFELAKRRFPETSTFILPCPAKEGFIELPHLMKLLGEREIAGLLVEGGPHTLRSFFQQGLIHEVALYLTPWIIADRPHKLRLSSVFHQSLGIDHKFTGRLLS